MPDALPDHERIRSARVVEVGYIATRAATSRNAGSLSRFAEI
jgi:hypothetical protein